MPSDFAICVVIFLIWIGFCISNNGFIAIVRSILLILAFVYCIDTGFRDLGGLLLIFSPWVIKKIVQSFLILKER